MSSFWPSSTTELCTLLRAHVLQFDSQEEESLNDILQAFWELESMGVSSPRQPVQQEFKESITFRNGRYEACLPWKKSHPLIPDNYEHCKRCLPGLLRRLKPTPDLREYDPVIQKQLDLGIIKPVLDSDFGALGKVHYLPHHPVIKRGQDTTRVRVVYDASSKAKDGDISLNECLFTAPNFNQQILAILLRFRSYPVAVTADTEKAFLMIAVSESDQDSLRFLWVDNIDNHEPVIRACRFSVLCLVYHPAPSSSMR